MEPIKIPHVLRMCRMSSCAGGAVQPLREPDPHVLSGWAFVQFLLLKYSPSEGWWSGWRSWWSGDTCWAQPQPEEGPAGWDSCVQCRKWYWEWNCRAVTWVNLQWAWRIKLHISDCCSCSTWLLFPVRLCTINWCFAEGSQNFVTQSQRFYCHCFLGFYIRVCLVQLLQFPTRSVKMSLSLFLEQSAP